MIGPVHIEFLVEGPSDKAALDVLVPEILGPEHSHCVHVLDSKHNLLARLPQRMAGYAKWQTAGLRIVVLVDEDGEDCNDLKKRLMAASSRAGDVEVLNRIVVEELEAWFFGDPDAIRAAYPRCPPDLGNKAPYRQPDAIKGGTWEKLEQVLQSSGYHRGGLAKIKAARDIAPHMDIGRNTSPSFRTFVTGLHQLVTT